MYFLPALLGAEACIFVCVSHPATCLCCYSPSELQDKGRCGRLWWHLLWCGSDWGLWGRPGLLLGQLVFWDPGRASQGSPASTSSLLVGWVRHTCNRKTKTITVKPRVIAGGGLMFWTIVPPAHLAWFPRLRLLGT